ncbi:MAG: putative DnaA chromosomal replication initiator protein [Pseudomonadota bacterium]|jgi:chromosomal replication initiator protein|uniref:Chromosomal replication initiator protein DnaA n=1 Tax=Thiothrix fructosivorans TaxID=111770 RepID=A0A8B0SLW9_9GAMM|nr:chromosomal replication initiator protein DnaA [Thiothrix fructosivorans]MBO0612460.1 chromosomal replication initiator protein DnaA [Thiothrix fructosivorans]QTX12061.1 chromosomal replication initiator protein DnaA [Thiothrix fructosivorans]
MLWQQCLQQLEQEVPDSEINTWLRALHAVEKRQALYLLAPNTIVLQQVHEQYLPRILFHSRIITGDNEFDVMLQIGSSVPTAPPALLTTPLQQPRYPQAQALSPHDEWNPVPLTHTQATAAAPTPAPISERFTNSLNPRMAFANFVEGKSNQLACAAAQQVGDQADTTYNPMFIYGGVGLGKTHLMHAIGNRILEREPGARVIYVYAERFVNDMISAIRNSRMEEFKQHYRSLDALLIDDIQFFAGKDRSMEEFFHTFNALLEGQKRIILASDKFPRDLDGIEDRLKTRFNWGLTVQIESPDLETRVAILRKKAEDVGLHLPNDVSFFIGKRFHSNIRDLEGALQRVIASMRLKCVTTISMDFVHNALRDQLASQDKMVSMSNIKKIVAQYYNIRLTDMDSKNRARCFARPRQIAMALSKELTNHSLPEIGDEFGGRDHTTVLHAQRKVVELRESDPKIEEEYRILFRTLTS